MNLFYLIFLNVFHIYKFNEGFITLRYFFPSAASFKNAKSFALYVYSFSFWLLCTLSTPFIPVSSFWILQIFSFILEVLSSDKILP